jgi:hypothetical protein
MATYRRTDQEIRQALIEQYHALIASSANYDAGNLWEAKRLATTIYNVVHDGGSRTKSLLGQLGIKSTIALLSCVKPPDKPGTQTLAIANGMCGVSHTHEGPVYTPVLSKSFYRRTVSFKEWYGETIFENQRKQPITRQNLVFSLRSQDGGSHFDPTLPDSAYLGLKDGTNTPLMFFPGDKVSYNLSEAVPIRYGHLANNASDFLRNDRELIYYNPRLLPQFVTRSGQKIDGKSQIMWLRPASPHLRTNSTLTYPRHRHPTTYSPPKAG